MDQDQDRERGGGNIDRGELDDWINYFVCRGRDVMSGEKGGGGGVKKVRGREDRKQIEREIWNFGFWL